MAGGDLSYSPTPSGGSIDHGVVTLGVEQPWRLRNIAGRAQSMVR